MYNCKNSTFILHIFFILINVFVKAKKERNYTDGKIRLIMLTLHYRMIFIGKMQQAVAKLLFV